MKHNLRQLARLVTAKPTSRQQRVLRWLTFAVVALALTTAAAIFGVSAQLTQYAYQSEIQQRAHAIAGPLTLFFTPTLERLGIVGELGRAGIISGADTEAATGAITTLIGSPPQTQTSAIILARSAPPDGDKVEARVLVRAQQGRQELTATFAFDATSQPVWYAGALQNLDDNEIYWANPESLAGQAIPGITLSIAWTEPADQNATCVAGVVVHEAALRDLLGDLDLARDGEVFVVTNQDRVLRLSSNIEGYIRLSSHAEFFASAAPQFRTLLAELGPDDDTPAPIKLNRDDGDHYCALTPLRFDNNCLWIGLDLPREKILANVRRTGALILGVLLSLLILGVLAAIALAWSYSTQLERRNARNRCTEASEEALRALIAEGEQDRLEFKSTLRVNLHTNKPDKRMEHSWLKTLVAFLNADGGTLLIGVEDDGNVLGVEIDGFANDDKYLLHCNNLIKQRIGLQHADLMAFAIRPIGDKRILVIDCQRSSHPVFLTTDDEEEFFVRIGPGTRKLPTSQALDYIERR